MLNRQAAPLAAPGVASTANALSRLLAPHLSVHHVTAHGGHLWRELADIAAKEVAQRGLTPHHTRPRLDWLDLNLNVWSAAWTSLDAYPALALGTLSLGEPLTPTPPPGHGIHPPVATGNAAPNATPQTQHLTCFTYNAQTMDTAYVAATHFTLHRYTVLDKWLADADVTIAALEETKSNLHKTFMTAMHTIYTTPAGQGKGGMALLVQRARSRAVRLHHSSHNILLVAIQLGHISCFVVAAHAPHTQTDASYKHQ